MVVTRKRRLLKSGDESESETSGPKHRQATAAAAAKVEPTEPEAVQQSGWKQYLPTMGAIHQAINDVFVTTIVPECFIILWLTNLIALGTLQLCLFGCVVVFVVLPLMFKYSVTLQRGILFLTFITYPKNIDYSLPHQQGLYATRNFRVSHLDRDSNDDDPDSHENAAAAVAALSAPETSTADSRNISIGVWHILPNYVCKRYAGPLRLTADEAHVVTEQWDGGSSASAAGSHQAATHHLSNQHQPAEAEFATIDDTNRERFFEHTLLEPNAEIVLYLHGNSNSRGAAHRVELYQLLRKLGYHVVALDYRGYGDSVGAPPTEAGVVRDAIAVYDWLRRRTKAPVFVWGHSLGTGIATGMMAKLAERNVAAPAAVVLESPFNNMAAEIRSHPMSRLFRNLPWFDWAIARPMWESRLRFESDEHIAEFRQPVMILHAEDDMVIPFELGYRLYRAALDTRGKTWGPVEFHRFGAENRFGHKYICRSIELPPMISAFFNTYRNTDY